MLKGIVGGGGTRSHSGHLKALDSLLYTTLKKAPASSAVKVGEMLSSSLSSMCTANRQKDIAHNVRAFSASTVALDFALTRDSLLCSLSNLWVHRKMVGSCKGTVTIVVRSRPSFLASFFCCMRVKRR